jgi:hypothetical protein
MCRMCPDRCLIHSPYPEHGACWCFCGRFAETTVALGAIVRVVGAFLPFPGATARDKELVSEINMALPLLSAAVPSRSLSRTSFVRSMTEIQVGDAIVGDLEHRRANSVMERQYPQAKSYLARSLELKKEYEQEEKHRESSRQLAETQRLSNAFQHLDHDLAVEWGHKMGDFETKCEDMWGHLRQRHAVQKTELKKACEPLLRLTPKFSPELLQMMRAETVLAKQNMYQEADEVRRRVEVRRKVELDDFNSMQKNRIQTRYQRLERKQEDDRKELQARIHGMKTTIRRKQRLAQQQLDQRKENNQMDMLHAHKLEFVDIQARVPGLLVRPRKTFMQASSTFKGTLMCRDLATTHMPGSWGGVLGVVEMQVRINVCRLSTYAGRTRPEPCAVQASASKEENDNLLKSVQFTGE